MWYVVWKPYPRLQWMLVDEDDHSYQKADSRGVTRPWRWRTAEQAQRVADKLNRAKTFNDEEERIP